VETLGGTGAGGLQMKNPHDEGRDRARHWVQNLAFVGTLMVLALVLYAAAITRTAERRERRQAATQTAQARVLGTAAVGETAGAVATATVRQEEAYRGTPVPVPPEERITPESAARLRTFARWGKGVPNALAFSPDGRNLAIATSVGVYLSSPEGLRFLEPPFSVHYLAFSADGRRLALASATGALWLWYQGEDRLRPFADDLGAIASLAFSPAGTILVAGYSESSSAWLWEEGKGVVLDIPRPGAAPPYRPCVALSPDGRYFAAAWFGGPLALWDVMEGRLVGELFGEGGFQRLAFSPDSSLLATASSTGTVRVWHLPDLSLRNTLEPEMGYLSELAFSPGGGWLASAGQHTIRVWDMRSGSLLRIFERMPGDPLAEGPGGPHLAFSPQETELASFSGDGCIVLSDLSTGTTRPLRCGFTPAWIGVAVAPDGERVAALSQDGRVWLWRLGDGSLERVLDVQEWRTGGSRAVVSPGVYFLGSRSAPGAVVLFRAVELTATLETTATASLRNEFPSWMLYPSVAGVAFSPDGRTLRVGLDNVTTLWEISTGRLLGWSPNETAALSAVGSPIPSPDGKWIAAPGPGGTLLLWQPGQESLAQPLAGHSEPVTAIAFSRDGRLLASASLDGSILLRRAGDGFANFAAVAQEVTPVWSMAFSPSGTLLALGRSDGNVRLVDTTTGLPVAELKGHTASVTSLAFSEDGRWLTTASSDGTIRLWGVGE